MNYRSASSSSAATATGQSPPAPQWYYAPGSNLPQNTLTASAPAATALTGSIQSLYAHYQVTAKANGSMEQLPSDSQLCPGQHNSDFTENTHIRGRGQGRGNHHGRERGSRRSSALPRQPYRVSRETPDANCMPTRPASPTETAPPAALWTASEPDPDSVIKMDDLVSRGVLAKFSDVVYQIPPDILASSRSSITVGAAIGSDKRRFNLKWLYDYHWLRFHPSENSMMCALCRSGGRANQFAKLGSKNFKTSALVDHCSSNDHKRSVAQFGNISVGFDPAAIAMVLLDNGLWGAQPLAAASTGQQHMDSILQGSSKDANSALGPLPAIQHAQPNNPPENNIGVHASEHPVCVKSESSAATHKANVLGPAASESLVSAGTIAQQSTSSNSTSSIETVSSIASRTTPPAFRHGAPPTLSKQQQTPDHEAERDLLFPRESQPLADVRLPGSNRPLANAAQNKSNTAIARLPDEKYAKEFEHAVQALLQGMSLNLPISSVIDLYRLQIQPRPLADIGSRGYSNRVGGSSQPGGDAIQLAGTYMTGTEAARTLQHIVSSEVLSLVKDEVSQSPAFSVVIDEAPLREHNSLVAHVLLYLRYMRRDPESDCGELQVITRFWRCVHLYHEHNGQLARRDPISLVLTLLERAKIDSSRLVCVSCERPVTREDEEVERRRQPHVIHWHGIFMYPNSLSPQVYEEISKISEDFVHFAMTLMDLCLFMYSHPSSFAFLGVDFQDMLYKTLYEIFLGEGSLSTRLPISLTPAIVTAITRNISQIMATVLALSKVSIRVDATPGSGTVRPPAGINMPDRCDTTTPVLSSTPRSPRSSLQIPLPVLDILVSSFGEPGTKKSVGRCPPADALLERLRDYSFLGCLHFMADILSQVKPIIDIASRSDMPTCVLGEQTAPTDHTLDQQLRAYIGTIKDIIESVTLMYGEEESDEPHDHANGSLGFGEDNGGSGGGEEEYSGFHLNEFMQLTDKDDEICHFRTFKVVNYSRIDSQSRLIELIRTASSAILRDLHQRFSAKNLHAIQALAAMWDPTQFPRSGGEVALFANRQVQTLASQLSRTYKAHTTGDLGVGDNALPSSKQALSGTLLIDPVATLREWSVFKAEVHQQVESELGVSATPTTRFVSGQIQVAYRKRLFSEGALAPSRRRLRSVEDSHVLNSAPSTDTCKKFGNLTKLAAAWNVLPLALSTDLHLFRRLYERQLARICREQAENKLQSINFDIGDTFSELLSRLSSPNSRSVKKKVTVYDLLQNSKVEVEQSARSLDKPVLEFELSGVTVDYFLRSIDAVTMALDHRLRLLSLEFTESPVALTRTPGGCPKWLQNAMRGYWKLACRPPKIARASTAVASVSNGVRHRACTSSHNTTASGGGPWSASTTSQTSEHHLHEAESLLHAGKWSMSTGTGGSGNIASGGSTSSSSTNTGGRAVPAMISPADRQVSCVPLPLPPLPVANSAQPAGQGCVVDTGPLGVLSANATADQVPMSISVSASAQSVATADFSSLPLLEALLSDSTQALRNPAVLSSQRTFLTSALPDSMLPPLAHGVGIKRPLDKESAAVAVRPISQADHGSEIRQQSTNDADIQAAKRMRQSLSSRPIMPAEPYSGGGGLDYQQAYQCPNGFFQQQQQQRHAALMSGAQEGSDLGTAIARMASNMGLDSVSTQALAASLSTQIIQQRSTQIDNSAAMYFGGGGRETSTMPIPTNPCTANMLSIGTLLQQNHPRADHQRYHPHPQHFQQQPHYPQQQQQQLSQSTQTMRQSGSTSSVQGMFGGGSDEINLQSDYASQFGYASQATVLNMHGLSGLPSAPVSSSQGRPSTLNSALPVGHPSTATAASFDQMIRERHVQNGHYPPPSLAQLSNASMAVLPPGSLDYQMRGFLRDNNSQ